MGGISTIPHGRLFFLLLAFPHVKQQIHHFIRWLISHKKSSMAPWGHPGPSGRRGFRTSPSAANCSLPPQPLESAPPLEPRLGVSFSAWRRRLSKGAVGNAWGNTGGYGRHQNPLQKTWLGSIVMIHFFEIGRDKTWFPVDFTFNQPSEGLWVVFSQHCKKPRSAPFSLRARWSKPSLLPWPLQSFYQCWTLPTQKAGVVPLRCGWVSSLITKDYRIWFLGPPFQELKWFYDVLCSLTVPSYTQVFFLSSPVRPYFVQRWVQQSLPSSGVPRQKSFSILSTWHIWLHSPITRYLIIWVCLKIGYIPNYSHLIGIIIINHGV